ncbi:hypothetical protein MWT96_02950 [Prescottella equi]|uniref:Uncharacterized protein n=1 Tax=Rhodococcus hoagii TaxID=43767 RepID=A0A9Q2SBM9_RHOHA|nr:hypothetical protein [Prescottella equi]MBM4488060.1 hypothetical protein [Prescottella equi]MBM4496051.1 hypothetical protein [Prescottella equi]MBM4499241.1 hypothetical protein [Prescottella equi]MBM4504065.1 hypothetical protein [Prescottella equi]MBM4514552.1 hypothetical protein [Prescottella equi]
MLNAVRVGWFLLAWVCAGLAIVAATSSMMQITSCELGYPDDGIMPGAECEASVARTYGPAIVAVLAIPALLCLLPAVFPERLLAGLVAGVLAVGSFGTFFASAPLSAFGYFVPAAVPAVALAVWHSWLPHRFDALSQTRGVRGG